MWMGFGFVIMGAFAGAEEISLHGQVVQAHAVSYAASGEVADFIVDRPTTSRLARNNQIEVTGWVAVYPNGDVSLVSVDRKFAAKWKMFDGRTVALNCDPHPRTPQQPAHPRLVQFHAGGEYMAGCETIDDLKFATDVGSLTVAGRLETSPDFRLIAASQVVDGTVTHEAQTIQIKRRSEIRFYPSGALAYFTPEYNGSYFEVHPLYGPLRFAQVPSGEAVSMGLTEDGWVEAGLIAEPFNAPHFGFEVPAGSGLVFTDDASHVLKAAKFSRIVKIQTQFILFEAESMIDDIVGGLTQFTVTTPFSATDPDSGTSILVGAGWRIWLRADGALVRLSAPTTP